MNKDKFGTIILVCIVAAVLYQAIFNSGPKNYDECMASKANDINNNYTMAAAMMYCENKFPPPNPYGQDVPLNTSSQINGNMSIVPQAEQIQGTLINNTNYNIKKITLWVSYKNTITGRLYKTRYYSAVYNNLSPGASATFAFDIINDTDVSLSGAILALGEPPQLNSDVKNTGGFNQIEIDSWGIQDAYGKPSN